MDSDKRNMYYNVEYICTLFLIALLLLQTYIPVIITLSVFCNNEIHT